MIASKPGVLNISFKMNRRSGGTRGIEDDAPLTLSESPSSTYFDTQSSLYTTHPTAIASSTRTATTSTATMVNSSLAPPVATTVEWGVTQGSANSSGWNNMGHGLKSGVIVATVIGLVLVFLLSIWFCCGGGKARWRRKASSNEDAGVLPLHTVPREDQPHNIGDAPPPRYEEVVPSQHQRLAGGISHTRDDEEAGMVADGKTPLSEIPFEDVVLEHTISESSSSQSFSTRHHNGIGDTRGHTNS